MALAGKTVSSRGMNVTYNEDGYAVKAVSYGHKVFANTEKSIAAPNIDTVLGGADRGGYGGSVYDQRHFSDKELAAAAELRDQLAKGEVNQRTADYFIEEIRARYGYNGGGANGNEYAALTFPKRAEERDDPPVYADAADGTAAGERSVPRDSYQERLKQQQERQTLLQELKAAQTAALSEAAARKADGLLSSELFDDKDKE